MDDNQVKTRIERAVALVEEARVPEDLREAAFIRALEMLAGTGIPKARGRRQRKATTPSADKGDPQRRPKTKRAGPKSLIAGLAEGRFFDTPRSLQDVQEHLRVGGHKYRQSAISPALLALTREKVLVREARQGEGGREFWVYTRSK